MKRTRFYVLVVELEYLTNLWKCDKNGLQFMKSTRYRVVVGELEYLTKFWKCDKTVIN